jgi:hypothetical protein
MNEESASRLRKVRGLVDFVFLIDATRNMAPCLGAVKKFINGFAETFREKDAAGGLAIGHWRAKIVGYRDYEYDPKHGLAALENNPFVESAEQFRAQLEPLEAKGGSGETTSLLDALYDVIEVGSTGKGAEALDANKWHYRRGAIRRVIIFTDTPFNPLLVAKGREGSTLDNLADAVIHPGRILLCIIAPDMNCYYEFDSIRKAEYHPIPCDSDEYAVRQRVFTEFLSKKENFERIRERVTRTGPIPFEEMEIR